MGNFFRISGKNLEDIGDIFIVLVIGGDKKCRFIRVYIVFL